eukprot:tig00020964_g16798.t1
MVDSISSDYKALDERVARETEEQRERKAREKEERRKRVEAMKAQRKQEEEEAARKKAEEEKLLAAQPSPSDGAGAAGPSSSPGEAASRASGASSSNANGEEAKREAVEFKVAMDPSSPKLEMQRRALGRARARAAGGGPFGPAAHAAAGHDAPLALELRRGAVRPGVPGAGRAAPPERRELPPLRKPGTPELGPTPRERPELRRDDPARVSTGSISVAASTPALSSAVAPAAAPADLPVASAAPADTF